MWRPGHRGPQMERQGHVSEPTRLAKLRVQGLGHKAEIQEEENAVPHSPFKEPDKVQHPLERFPSQIIILFPNMLTGLMLYFLGSPLMTMLILRILDKKLSYSYTFHPNSFLHCGHHPLHLRSSRIESASAG